MQNKFNLGIILFKPAGPLGGAPKRFTELILYLNSIEEDRYYYFLNRELYEDLIRIYGEKLSKIKIIIIERFDNYFKKIKIKKKSQSVYNDKIENKGTIILRYYFRYFKNLFYQFKIYKEIDEYRNINNIKVMMGIFSGILPLYFYIKSDKAIKKAGVIFSNMDSWFSNVMEMNEYKWFCKYYTFNYGLINSDKIEFLSPYIYSGIKKKGIIIDNSKISVLPNSFVDYSKCIIKEKNNFEVAFSARLEQKKNPLLYLDAVKEIVKKYNDIYFYLLGEGSLEHEIRDFIHKYNLKNKVDFRFCAEPTEIFSKTSVFVSLQETNNYPSQSILEAMGCGNAIIASDTGDTHLFFKEDIGKMIKLDKNELSNAVEEMYLNRENTIKQGKSARKFAMSNHTVVKTSEYYIKLFEETYNQVFKI